jgi:uncharacterized protein YndB with AHSA1/START domain
MSNPSKLQHEITIAASASDVIRAITTREGLLGWNTANVSGDGAAGSAWHLKYSGRPDFTWLVERADDRGVKWRCTHGPGDSVGTTVEYILAPLADGRTRLSLVHDGWPHTGGNFTKCNTLWGGLLHHLKRFVETRNPDPAHS